MEISEQNNKIINLLEEQNKMLKQMLSLQQTEIKAEKRERILHYAAKAVPYIILLIVIIWIYFSIKTYLDSLNQQIGEIKNSVGSVFETLNNQYEFLKSSLGNLFSSFKNLIPDFSGIGEKIKESLPL